MNAAHVFISALFQLLDDCTSWDAVGALTKPHHWNFSRLNPAVYQLGAHSGLGGGLGNGEQFDAKQNFLVRWYFPGCHGSHPGARIEKPGLR